MALGLDSWGPAGESYRANFSHPLIDRDIEEVSADEILEAAGLKKGRVDLVAGGPPCQGFSIQRIGADTDRRNQLVLEFGRMVKEIRPRGFLMENVPGLLGKRGRHVADAFSELLAPDYETVFERVNAADHGVPQIRRRILCFGWRRGAEPVRFPAAKEGPVPVRTAWDAIGDLPSPPLDFTAPPEDPLHARSRLSELNQERLRSIPPGGGFEDLPMELRVACHRGGASKIGHRNVYGRLAPDEPAVTITARFDSFTRGKFAHPKEDRNITLREGARLQTFPDEHRFFGTREEIAALIGNAVPPRLAEVAGKAILESIAGERRSERSRTLAA